MRTEQAPPVRLIDYRPPDWLVETVDLDVSLDPKATRVRATLTLKPNPKAAAPAPGRNSRRDTRRSWFRVDLVTLDAMTRPIAASRNNTANTNNAIWISFDDHVRLRVG